MSVKDLCSNIAEDLNANPLWQKATATRNNIWIERLEDGPSLKVAVIPAEIATSVLTRGAKQRRVQVVIAIAKRLGELEPAARLAAEDEVIELAGAIEDRLYGRNFGDWRFTEYNETTGTRIVLDIEEGGTRGIVRINIQAAYLGS